MAGISRKPTSPTESLPFNTVPVLFIKLLIRNRRKPDQDCVSHNSSLSFDGKAMIDSKDKAARFISCRNFERGAYCLH